MVATHLVFASADGSPLVSDRDRLRVLVRALLRACADVPLLAFHLSDGHIHVVARIGREAAGRLAQRIAVTLRPHLEHALAPANFRGVRDQAHLVNTFEYVLRNDEKHGVDPDPWRENSALPDLLGLRALPSTLIVTVRRALPRVTGGALRAMAGWPELIPAVKVVSATGSAAAAAAALALPDLTGRAADAVAARRAILEVVSQRGSALRGELGRTDEAIRLLRRQPPRPELVRAVGLQLALREAVGERSDAPFATEGAKVPWRELKRFSRR